MVVKLTVVCCVGMLSDISHPPTTPAQQKQGSLSTHHFISLGVVHVPSFACKPLLLFSDSRVQYDAILDLKYCSIDVRHQPIPHATACSNEIQQVDLCLPHHILLCLTASVVNFFTWVPNPDVFLRDSRLQWLGMLCLKYYKALLEPKYTTTRHHVTMTNNGCTWHLHQHTNNTEGEIHFPSLA